MNLNHHAANEYQPWLTEIPTLRCPSDPGVGLPSQGRTNYACCLGDALQRQQNGLSNNANCPETSSWARHVRASGRGIFAARKDSKFRDILDGLANTIAAGEIATDLGDNDNRTKGVHGENATGGDARLNPSICQALADPARPQFWDPAVVAAHQTGGTQNNRGYKWAHGRPFQTGMTTITPPNSILCMRGSTGRGVFPPSSRHQGGCHILMADGAVVFITDSIESGNQTAPTVHRKWSPDLHGTWFCQPLRTVGCTWYQSQSRTDRRAVEPVIFNELNTFPRASSAHRSGGIFVRRCAFVRRQWPNSRTTLSSIIPRLGFTCGARAVLWSERDDIARLTMTPQDFDKTPAARFFRCGKNDASVFKQCPLPIRNLPGFHPRPM